MKMASYNTAMVLDQESLFSLEVIVEKLTLPNIVCRFPAIAFRLLDYPTLIIYHVEPELADTIRSKVTQDPNYKIPHQFHELQDKNSSFPIKKGKSCLFKVTPNFFQKHLATTPLYVMLIDTFPEVPKLIGSCSVPLDTTMNKICDDIMKLGISVPSTQGETSEYNIYNLMGSKIGTLVFGHRLVSLGVGLLSHIHDKDITKMNQTKSTLPHTKDGKKAMETAEIILKDLQAADKKVHRPKHDLPLKMITQTIQTDNEMMQTTGSQTEKKVKLKTAKRLQHNRQASPDIQEVTDIFVTNIICPPPLFYNSEAAEPEVPVFKGLTFANGKFIPTPLNPSSESNDFSDTVSEASTIRQEDRFSDSDMEEYVDFESAKVRTKTKGTKQAIRKTLKRSVLSETNSVRLKESAKNVMMAPGVFGNMTQFPMLNTLLNEILALQGVQGSGHSLQEIKLHRPHSPYQTPRKRSSGSVSVDQNVASKEKENREEVLARLATPRKGSSQEDGQFGKISHRQCMSSHDDAVKNKGWIRSYPTVSVKKTKLTYGMTNTQRLRLAKQNPELLKTLEKAEVERRITKGMPPSARVHDTQKTHTVLKPSKGTKLALDKPKMPYIPPLGKISVDTSLEDTGDMSVKTSTDIKPHKKPVPTPRLSRQLSKDMMILDEIKMNYEKKMNDDEIKMNYEKKVNDDGRTKSPEVPKRKSIGQLPSRQSSADHSQSEISNQSDSKTKSKSIEIHLPMFNGGGEDDDGTDLEGTSEFGENERFDLGRTRTLVKSTFNYSGIPDEQPTRDVESRQSGYKTYSEDFDTEDGGAEYSDGFDTAHDSPEEPILRKVVDHYSDDSYESTEELVLQNNDQKYSVESTEVPDLKRYVEKYSDVEDAQSCAGEEPVLRKVVDKYSDDDKSETLSYHSRKSFRSDQSDQQPKNTRNEKRLKLNTTTLNPTISSASPLVAMKNPIWPNTGTREPLAVGDSTTTVDPGEVPNGGVSESFESTAYISKSQVPSLGTSLESTGDPIKMRYPRPSPRRTVEKMSSIHTASISSYEPSDPDNLVEDYESYSDESVSDVELMAQSAVDARVTSEAKLGYTWT